MLHLDARVDLDEIELAALDVGASILGGLASSRLDKVLVRDPTGGPRMPCFINSIRKLDVKALRASEQELRQAQVQEREENTK